MDGKETKQAVDNEKIDHHNQFIENIWRELSIYKSKMLVPENVVLNPKCSVLQDQSEWIIRDVETPYLKTKLTVFGVPVIRSYDLEPNEFKIIVKL